MKDFDIGSILISEEDYAAEMKRTVEPYIAARREETTLSREEGHPIYCVRYGADCPKAAVLISHGFTESTEKYREIVYYFLKANLTVYVYDHCGHGRSYRLTENLSKVHVDSWERYAQDLLFVAHAAQDACPALPLFLYGHSMGGAVAAAAASMEPELFRRVILSSPMIRPKTGSVPWFAAKMICAVCCAVGKSEDFVIGQGEYRANGEPDDSATLSRARLEYYEELRRGEPLYQTNGATYSWLRNAARMNRYLQETACRRIHGPVLIFQAEDDAFVVNSEQDVFAEKLGKNTEARLIRVPGARHEIFNAPAEVTEKYWWRVLAFYGN